MTTLIRRATTQDVEAVLSLAQDFAASFELDEAAFRATFPLLLADPNAFLAVAERGDGVDGYVLAFNHHTFYANGRVAWVEELMVEASCRRQRIGQSLMKNVEAWAAGEGCRLVALATRRAAQFYKSLDYEASATYFRKLL